MCKIRDYIENIILEEIWEPLPKWLKVCFSILIAVIILPFFFPKYDEWKGNIESVFFCPKQVQSDTIVYVDSIPEDTAINQDTIIKPPPPCNGNSNTRELVREAREMKNLSQADDKYQEAYGKLSKLCQDKYKQRKERITSTFELTTRVKMWSRFFEDIGY